MPKKYSVKKKVSDDIVEQLLHNRGVKGKKEKEAFLNPDFENHLHDPFLLPDMEKAAKRVLQAMERGERIGIWSDYDADGIPGGALLHDFFKLSGFNNFMNYIPDRHIEGYGLNAEGIEELVKDGVTLLITVDCGIRDHAEVEHARKKGMEAVITDHHEPQAGKNGDDLPDAFAIINPKRSDSKYPENILCGAGVAWKLIEAILKIERRKDGKIKIKEGQEKWLLDLVGIATLSDMVPLIGENRALAHFGMKVLRRGRRPGLRKLFKMLRVNLENLSEDDICFLVTPRLNAASRMGHPRDAFKLLTASSEEEADEYARHLDNINNDRKVVVAGIVKEAKKKIREKFESLGEKPVIVLGNPDWRPALLGLAANSIVEEYGRPAFLWGRAPAPQSGAMAGEAGEVFKGSCRSEGVTDVVELMEKAKKVFFEFGGHKMSGGFSVEGDNIHKLEEALVEASAEFINKETEIWADAELSVREVDEKMIADILKVSPFGVGNDKPVFIFRDVLPERVGRFGKAKEHLSIELRDGSRTLRAISFFASPDQFGDALKEGIKTNLAANVEKSYFNGSSEIRLRIVDFFM